LRAAGNGGATAQDMVAKAFRSQATIYTYQSGLAIHSTTVERISDDTRFTATDAVYPDRMQDIRGV
jgi:hypothetical protein